MNKEYKRLDLALFTTITSEQVKKALEVLFYVNLNIKSN
jgi:hypothetical protein